MTIPRASIEKPLVANPQTRKLRIVISCLLLLHLSAIVIAPLSVAPASMLMNRCWTVFRPYLQAAYLNHGYHFFAPEPGPSHLVRYELELPYGVKQTGFFPDRAQHRPRLIYHRHFMLSEFLNTLAADEANKELLQAVTRSYATRLLTEHRAERVTLHLRRHYIRSPRQFLRNVRVDDPSLYAERPLGTFSEDQL